MTSPSPVLLAVCLCSCGGSRAASPPAAPAPARPQVTGGAVESTSAPPSNPAPSPEAPPPAATPSAEPPAISAAPPATAERPANVVARSIGMHIGGGPNDAVTKAPFIRTIEGAFDAVVACTGLVPAGHREGTFGIDLLVGKEGGKPEVTNPRTGIPGPEFRACVVGAFQGLVFEKPRRGATKLSYSLRFDVR